MQCSAFFGRKKVRSAIQNALLNTLTMGTAFLLEVTPGLQVVQHFGNVCVQGAWHFVGIARPPQNSFRRGGNWRRSGDVKIADEVTTRTWWSPRNDELSGSRVAGRRQ